MIHSPGSATVGIQQPEIVVLMVFESVASRTGALLHCSGRSVRHIPSKSASEMVLEDGARRGVGPRLLVLLVRLLVVLDYTALVHWMSGSIPPLALQCGALSLKIVLAASPSLLASGPKRAHYIYGIRCIPSVS